MERGNSTHGARQDEALTDDLGGELGPGGSNREEWAAAEPGDDGEPPAPGGPIAEPEADTGDRPDAAT